MRRLLLLLFCVVLVSVSCKRKGSSGLELSAADRLLLDKYSSLVGERVKTEHLPQYRFIDTWWGTPHRLGGTTTRGIDCSGFVHQYFLEFHKKAVARNTVGLYKEAEKRNLSALEMGDLVFFDLNKSGKLGHVGIYLQNGRFVHASTSKGVRIDYMEDIYYRAQRKYGGRIR